MGRQIVADDVEGSDNPHQALIACLDLSYPAAVLARTAYADRASGVER